MPKILYTLIMNLFKTFTVPTRTRSKYELAELKQASKRFNPLNLSLGKKKK